MAGPVVLRAAYAKMQAEYEDSSSESDKSVDGEEGGKTPAISRPGPPQSSIGGGDGAQRQQQDLRSSTHNTFAQAQFHRQLHSSAIEQERLGSRACHGDPRRGDPTKNRVVKSGCTSSNRLYASKRTSRTHRKQIVMSSRESSLEEQWKMLQASNNLNRTRRLTISPWRRQYHASHTS